MKELEALLSLKDKNVSTLPVHAPSVPHNTLIVPQRTNFKRKKVARDATRGKHRKVTDGEALSSLADLRGEVNILRAPPVAIDDHDYVSGKEEEHTYFLPPSP